MVERKAPNPAGVAFFMSIKRAVKTWYVYILQCVDKALYTGVTTDVRRRLKAHRAGKGSRVVRSKLPVRLVYQEKHKTQSRALKREAEIKSWPRKQKLALVRSVK